MKSLKVNKNIIKFLIITLLVTVMLVTVSACSRNYSDATVAQTSARYSPYDYYYYPNSSIYFHISTGYYHYYDGRTWIRVSSLPSRYILNSGNRVRLVINSDRPYIAHNKHRARYAPRPSYRQDIRRDKIERINNRSRYKNYRKQ